MLAAVTPDGNFPVVSTVAVCEVHVPAVAEYDSNVKVSVFPLAVGLCGAIVHAAVPPGLTPSAFGVLFGRLLLTTVAATADVPDMEPTASALR
jgi:hypothetical protein